MSVIEEHNVIIEIFTNRDKKKIVNFMKSHIKKSMTIFKVKL